ncbi:MAG: glycyl-radical enzyme activating protein, partial [Planctomycetes bacterium]|nr:glycyl-radical enzyme activating protein [Planctomycetota bacterium]
MGVVYDIQRFCLHDGPGLRTTVFLKGCPLSCRWCSNPESQRFAPEMFFNASRCMRCGACAAACQNSAIQRMEDGGMELNRGACIACGACEAVCPMGALVGKGREMTAEEVLREVEKDRSFFETSGGGATVSGGEPFAQPVFLRE